MNVNSLYGFKLDQTQGYTPEGVRVPLTRIKMEPNVVTQLRQHTSSIQVVLGKKKHLTKPLQGIINKLQEKINPRYFREINTSNESNVGTKINVTDVFFAGDKVKVTGISKGKGFQGVVRRHGFAGGPKTHGQSDRQRHPGSIGQSTTPGRVYKGKRMAGHMGSDTVTIKGLEIFEVKPEESLLVVKGLVPGGRNALLKITKEQTRQVRC